jgi:transposase
MQLTPWFLKTSFQSISILPSDENLIIMLHVLMSLMVHRDGVVSKEAMEAVYV